MKEAIMKHWKSTVTVALPAFAFSACAVMPAHDAELDDARAAVVAAQSDPQVVSLAPVELNNAVVAMRRADDAWSHHEHLGEVHHLAHLAWTQAKIATETARLKSAEAAIASAHVERDRLQLQARTREAEAAQREAARARAEAEANRADAISAQALAAAAAAQAQSARAEAEAAQQQAANAQAQAQSLQAALADLQARPTDRGMVVTMGDLLFDTGSARLNPGGLRVVDHLVQFMNAYPQRRVSIEGFTDGVGTPTANQALSERRAEAVRLALIDRGVDPARLEARGYGAEYPVASNAKPAGRQMNRRVEIVISDRNGAIASRTPPHASPRG
jgi:outer membrane protein OmpA-like peptidoglycan-associated protein